MRDSRKFVFDAESARRLANVVMKVPTLLAREHQFARPPFDLTWIEFPAYEYWKVFRDADPQAYDAAGRWGDQAKADKTIGFLIDQNRVNVMSENMTLREPMMSLHQYRMHTEWPVQDQINMAEKFGTSRMGLDIFLWGTTWGDLSDTDRRALRGYNVVEYMPLPQSLLDCVNGPDTYRGSVGEFRTLIALLLIMNRPSLISYKHTLPNTRGYINAKPNRPFMSYTAVTIPIDPVPTLRLIGTPQGENIERRRHEVKGHYCHDQTSRDYKRIAGCMHTYQPTDDKWVPLEDPSLSGEWHRWWVCSQCGGKRWWREKFERGNAELGFVHHTEYRITG